MKIDQMINGANLRKAAKLVIDSPPLQSIDVSMLCDGDIIFCKTDYIFYLFNVLNSLNTKNKYKLITHCSDYAITKAIFNLRPLCIAKWFAQNVDFVHPDLIPLPIGVENHCGYSKGGYIKPEVFDLPLLNKDRDNLVYCNFSVHTHPNRFNVWTTLADNDMCVMDQDKSFVDYCEQLQQYSYVASPRGNGIDCHRTWEALYFGAIPVVEAHPMYDSWSFLPLIQIRDWNQLNSVLQNSSLAVTPEISTYLNVNYWIDKIKNYAC